MNSKDGINFSPAAQKCIACLSDQYIIDSNNPRFECQICPVGAVCVGSTLQGLVEGSVWTKRVFNWHLSPAKLPKGESSYAT